MVFDIVTEIMIITFMMIGESIKRVKSYNKKRRNTDMFSFSNVLFFKF